MVHVFKMFLIFLNNSPFSSVVEEKAVTLTYSSRNVLRAMKLHLTFHPHEEEWIRKEFSFLGELM